MIQTAELTGKPAALAKAAATIREMESEHSAVGDLLKKMREVTDNYRLPEDACPTYTVAFHKLEELEGDLFQHIHLENNVLLPRLGVNDLL